MTLAELVRLAIKRIREEKRKERMRQIFAFIPGGTWK